MKRVHPRKTEKRKKKKKKERKKREEEERGKNSSVSIQFWFICGGVYNAGG